jgi:hypothetical protein
LSGRIVLVREFVEQLEKLGFVLPPNCTRMTITLNPQAMDCVHVECEVILKAEDGHKPGEYRKQYHLVDISAKYQLPEEPHAG